jgi:putative NADPH-quinone reductase
MNISLILANPKVDSFCHALARTTRDLCERLGHQVRFHDLCAEGFDPILTEAEIRFRNSQDPLLEQHAQEITEADALILVHPNWWGQPPAILKGWVDRVMRSGVAYAFDAGDNGEGVPRGLLKAKMGIVLNTSDTPWEREREAFGDPLDLLWGKCILPYCGVKNFARHTYGVVVSSTVEERRDWLKHAERFVEEALQRSKSNHEVHE